MLLSEEYAPSQEKIDGRKGPRSDEVKARIREACLKAWEKYKQTDDYQRFRKTLSEKATNAWKNREHNGYNSRPKHTKETKRKMSEAHKQRWKCIKEALKKAEEREVEN